MKTKGSVIGDLAVASDVQRDWGREGGMHSQSFLSSAGYNKMQPFLGWKNAAVQKLSATVQVQQNCSVYSRQWRVILGLN